MAPSNTRIIRVPLPKCNCADIVKKLIEEYENKSEYYDIDGWIKQGAIGALEEVFRRMDCDVR